MNPDEINRAIAESVGWKPTTDSGWCLGPDDEPIISPPNYHGDLNAIQEAVMTLKETDTKTLYLDHMYAVACKSAKERWEREWFYVIATAPQRCEAYLRTMNLWRDQ